MEGPATILTVGLAVPFVVWGVWLFVVHFPRRMRLAVEADVRGRGGRLTDLRNVLFFSLLTERNTRRWDVKWTDKDGTPRTGRVQTGLFTGLRWMSGPHAGEGSKIRWKR